MIQNLLEVYYETDVLLVHLGGNFCAGYDLSELAASESVANLPDAETLPRGRGPMVNWMKI